MKNEANAAETQLLSIALPILQGLLASGHYTQIYSDGPGLIRHDNGADRKTLDITPVFFRRYSGVAITDALDIAVELLGQIKIEVLEPGVKSSLP